MRQLTVIFSAGLFASMNVAAEIYKCTDAGGAIDYSDKPCKGKSSIFTPQSRPAIDEGVELRNKKTQQLLRAYREENAQKKEQAAVVMAEKEKRNEECARARNHYHMADRSSRLYRINENGEHIYYTDKEHAEITREGKAAIEKWCD